MAAHHMPHAKHRSKPHCSSMAMNKQPQIQYEIWRQRPSPPKSEAPRSLSFDLVFSPHSLSLVPRPRSLSHFFSSSLRHHPLVPPALSPLSCVVVRVLLLLLRPHGVRRCAVVDRRV